MKNEVELRFLDALEENKGKLFRICSIYAKDEDDAKDLFQEVLVQIWKSMNTFKGGSAIGTWMFRVALNVCLRFKSKSDKNQKRLIRLDSITIQNLKNEENNEPDTQKLKALRSCIKKMKEADKAVVALYLEGMAYREISNILGLSENHVAVKIKRIKIKLSNCINEMI